MTWKITGAPGTGDDLLYSQAGTPTLDLRFASSKSLNDNVSGQNLIDFTRGGNGVGTYVGSDGLIKNSVVNLLLRSEEFDDASWLTSASYSSIATNSVLAPDGTLTGDAVTFGTGGFFFQTVSVISSTVYTFSFYRKAGDSNKVAVYDATNAVWITQGATLTVSSTANGWQRVVTTFTTPPTCVSARVYPERNTSGTARTMSFWGAQLEANTTTPGEYVKTTSSISGAPRFDHDPATGESLGLLIEESRANLLLNSATLATQDVTVTAVAHTLSFYGTGTVTLSGTHSATVVGTGAYPTRTTLTFTPTAGTLTVTVSGTVQYANLEIGSFATSWIPTAGTTVTRNADVAQITGSNFSRWYSQSQGTVLGSAKLNDLTANRVIAGISTAASINRITIGTATGYGYSVVDNNVVQVNSNVGTKTSDSVVAFAIKADDFAASANGSSVGTDNLGTVPSADRLTIGVRVDLNTATFINAPIRRLAYFDRRLPNAVLQAITAP